MTEKQYADLQRKLGIIEGIACTIQDNDGTVNSLFDVLASLDAIINEIKEADDV